ncbi:tetratricopeptide repeat protein [Neisseriaceae bacterium TC5R-5]|nr:tetratricopeptide repeat protein [Neisseriaceae bacterium TC5R-5]
MHTLIAFATGWGPQFGGINSFNHDLLLALATAYPAPHTRVYCVVPDASPEQQTAAAEQQVTLIALGSPTTDGLPATLETLVWHKLNEKLAKPPLPPEHTVWLGHDRITGAIALAAAQTHGGKSALIHHMSYQHYEAFAENSHSATTKAEQQEALFQQADIVLAIGPLLRDALADMLPDHTIEMLIPGLADITEKPTPKTFKGFISGRLSEQKIKQAHLGVAGFASAIKRADNDSGLPDCLQGSQGPTLTLRGVDMEHSQTAEHSNAEQGLKSFAQQYAGRVVNLQALPFTTDRQKLFTDLSRASVALMPSWHEGFGLVAWDAIAAGVPLLLSQASGVYRLLQDENLKHQITPLDIAGSVDEPFFQDKDCQLVADALIQIAKNPPDARNKASQLRNTLLQRYSWKHCADQFAEILGWSTPAPAQNTPIAVHTPAPTITPQAPSLLQLPQPRWQPNSGLSPNGLLRAEEAAIPFDPAREPFLQQQWDWVHDSTYPLTVRLLTGSGGSGKTRLALELCRRLQQDGWQAGLLPHTTPVSDVAGYLANSTQASCLVLDYAETRQTAFLHLLKALRARPPAQSVRLLLLARDSGEWWQRLPHIDSACTDLLDGLATSGPFMLPSLHDSLDSRVAAYQRAMQALAAKLGLPPNPSQPQLHEAHFAQPLYLQMAALLVLQGEQAGSAQSLTRTLLGYEQRYWQRALGEAEHPEHPEHAELLLTLATLADGLPSSRNYQDIWQQASDSDKRTLQRLFRQLTPLYPQTSQGLPALRPDLLGEALVAHTLLSDAGASLLDAVLGSGQPSLRRNSLTVLARMLRQWPARGEQLLPALSRHFAACADDLVTVIIATPSPLPGLVEQAFGQLTQAQQAQVFGILEKHRLNEILPLVDLSVLLWQSRTEQLAAKTKIDSEAFAVALNHLSICLVAQGSFSAALPIAKQAVDIYAELAANNPESFKAEWAGSLHNYAARLVEQGQFDEALKYDKQAVEIYVELAANNPESFKADLARSLNNYAASLADQGQLDEAVKYDRQTLKIYTKLVTKNSELFQPDWAMFLNNYAKRLAEQRQFAEATKYAKQALEIRKELACKQPERFKPDWATSLHNYAVHLAEQGQLDEATQYAKQAVEIHEELARNKPERFKSEWAGSLNNYANRLAAQGRLDEATQYAKQAVDIFAELADNTPQRFESDWAKSLANYAQILRQQGDIPQALARLQQALDIFQKLAQTYPARFTQDLEEYQALYQRSGAVLPSYGIPA